MKRIQFSTARRFASSLIIAEHDNSVLSAGTLATVTAASKIGGQVFTANYIKNAIYNVDCFKTKISLLVVGKNLDSVTKHASGIEHVSKVLALDNDALSNFVAEEMSDILVQIANQYTHVLAPSTNNGKNFVPRAAAILDSSPLMDVLAVVDENTFKRPMYAGNAIATVKMSNPTKVKLSFESH